jgi:hypothetical protein
VFVSDFRRKYVPVCLCFLHPAAIYRGCATLRAFPPSEARARGGRDGGDTESVAHRRLAAESSPDCPCAVRNTFVKIAADPRIRRNGATLLPCGFGPVTATIAGPAAQCEFIRCA